MVLDWLKNRHIGQWNRIEISDINPYIYDQLIVDKWARTHSELQDSLFNKWYWGKGILICQPIKLDLYLIPVTKINSKYSKSLNVKLNP